MTGASPVATLPERPPGLQRTLRALLTGTTHLVSLLDPDGTIAYVGPSVEPLLGYTPAEVVRTNVLSYLHPDDLAMAVAFLAQRPTDGPAVAPDGGTPFSGLCWDTADVSGDYRLRHARGHWVPFEVARNDFTGDPAVGGILVIARTVAVRRALDEALTALAHDDEGDDALRKLAEYAHRRVPGTSASFHVIGDAAGWVHDGTAAEPSTALGHAVESLAGDGLEAVDLRRPDPRVPEPARRMAVDAGFQACWHLPVPVRQPRVYMEGGWESADGPRLGGLVVWSARYQEPLPAHLGALERVAGLAGIVLRRRVATDALRQRVTYDAVTGALSRIGFEATAADHRSERRRDPYTIMVIDLDDFKRVNDNHGHPVGDQVLRVAAQRIQALLRPGDTLGRLGGDEFVLRVTRTGIGEAEAIAARILAGLSAPVPVGGTSVTVRASIGIAASDTAHSERELVARADAAMYVAKRAGKGRSHVWRGAGRVA